MRGRKGGRGMRVGQKSVLKRVGATDRGKRNGEWGERDGRLGLEDRAR